MRLIYFYFLFMPFGSLWAQEVSKTQSPKWVNSILSGDFKQKDRQGAYRYLLIDLQDNVESQEAYKHYVIEILNDDGVQKMSTIDVDFDPSFQSLNFHTIDIIRNGKRIDKLRDCQIMTIQREQSMESSLYDGSITAIINLSDVRKSDVLEYSYTRKGYNPVNSGYFSWSYYHQFTIPVNRVYNRLLVDESQTLKLKRYNGATEPSINKRKHIAEYEWDVGASDFKLYDNNVPSWLDVQKSVKVSNFENWSDVAEWAVPLYKYNDSEINKIKWKEPKVIDEDLAIGHLIRMVQDEIRYLGFESGIGAYKPNSPLKVFNQRYGDCKDKSLLLVSLLRRRGHESYPVLVNTTLHKKVLDELPSNSVFDHCVVYFKYEGEDYFVDPTISNQGGDINNIYFPDYGYGLIVRDGMKELIELPKPAFSSLSINEMITVDEIGGPAKFYIRSQYSGSGADNMRSSFANSSLESIQKDYLNYYSNLYPGIEINKPIKYFDNGRFSDNKFVIEEYYIINDFWLLSDDSTYLFCETYPLVLESYIDYPNSPDREMEYFVGNPFSYAQITSIDLPEPWSVNSDYKKISGDGFQYINNIESIGNSVVIKHNYERQKKNLQPDSVKEFIKKHDQIKNQLSFYLTKSDKISEFKLSWISVGLTVLSLLLGAFVSIKVNNYYNPEAWQFAEDKPIGGWLVLPAIGLVISPFVLGYQIFNADYFNAAIWSQSYSGLTSDTFGFKLFLALELVVNILLLIFTLLVLIQFFQRRTSLPLIISVYYSVNFVIPLFDSLAADFFFGVSIAKEDITNLVKSFVAVAIWVPYFNISERSKSTFCKGLCIPLTHKYYKHNQSGIAN
ncbi:MAG: DUF3857 domain-containing protein [Cyclobacteriaceae bacterium]